MIPRRVLFAPGTAWRSVVVLAAVFFLLPATPSAAKSMVVDTVLQQRMLDVSPEAEIPVIVHLEDTVDIRRMAVPTRREGPLRRQARAELVRTLKDRFDQSRQPLQGFLEQHGISGVKQLWMINALAFTATPGEIEAIAAMPAVKAVSYDQVIEKPRVEKTQVSGPAESNLGLINAPDVWDLGFAGQGTTIAIVDSGVDIHHPDLGPSWRGGSNSWFNAVAANCSSPLVTCATSCDTNTTEPCDYLDPFNVAHGTGVAGLAVGGNSGGTFIGAAPEAQWIAVKIFDSADEAQISVIHDGFQWLLDPDGDSLTDDAPDIVNASWGFATGPNSCDSNALIFQPDVQALRAAGISVVFSAGNTGPSPSSSIAPANYPESFAAGSVGAPQSDTLVSSFSARGPSACDGTIYPEAVAPGFAVKTADLSFGGLPNRYLQVSGTSFAAPHVSGVMALLLSAFPAEPTTSIETALRHSAPDLGGNGPDNDYGYGLIDALAAFEYLAGNPRISVTDSIVPETDHQVPFGNVSVGGRIDASVRIANVGRPDVALGLISPGLPFSIVNDGCSGNILSAGDFCTVGVRFQPTAAGNFNGSLVVTSNVPGQEQVVVALSGSGVQTGSREIAVTDSIHPENDGLLAFGQVIPGESESAGIQVNNSGTLDLTLGSIDTSQTDPPLSVTSDGCSGRTLLVGETCTITVRFAPSAAGTFAGSLAIPSNADTQPLVTVDMTGTGNTPPTPPTPLRPVDGAIIAPEDRFYWSPASDADGDRVEQFLVYDTDPGFGLPTERQVDTIAATLLGSGLLLGSLAAGMHRRRKLAILLVAAALLLGMAACGGNGGGGDGDGPNLPADAQSTTLPDLVSGTTYYWKMVARDSRGAETESGIRSFTVE